MHFEEVRTLLSWTQLDEQRSADAKSVLTKIVELSRGKFQTCFLYSNSTAFHEIKLQKISLILHMMVVILVFVSFNHYMSQLSSDLLLRAQRRLGNEHFLRQVRTSIKSNQQKISRQVYNSDCRNMKKFTQEWIDFQKKFNLTKQSGFASQSLPIKKGSSKYEQNELLELSFADRFKVKEQTKGVKEEVSAITIRNSSVDGSSNRNVTFKNSLNRRYTFRVNYVQCSKIAALQGEARQKSNSFTKAQRLSLRKRVVTQWDHSPNNQSLSRLSAQKNQTNLNPPFKYHSTDDYIIDVTRDKMDKFIRSLHRLEWAYQFLKGREGLKVEESREFREHMKGFQFDPDTPINELAINHMISRRYRLHSNYLQDVYEQRNRQLSQAATSYERKRLADSQDYPLLSALSSHSILRLLQKNLNSKEKIAKLPQNQLSNGRSAEISFSLPYSQFISHKQTKNSIYQLVGMNAKLGLKLAFTIFDKNKNGVIDEDDLLQLISLSRQLPSLQTDIVTLSRGMLALRQSKKPFFQKPRLMRQDSNESKIKDIRDRNITLISKQSKESEDRSHIIAIEEEKDSVSEESEPPKSLSTSRFSLDKLYIFLKKRQKNPQGSSKKAKTIVQPLNFPMFCKVFEFKRPYLIYDLFQFIFDASIQDFKESIQQQINNHLSRLRSTQISASRDEEETLEEKWNRRLYFSNSILKQLLQDKQKQPFH